jgi:hypothetical protein
MRTTRHAGLSGTFYLLHQAAMSSVTSALLSLSNAGRDSCRVPKHGFILARMSAAQGPNNLQASDDELESMTAQAMTKAGFQIDRRHPRSAVPRGEAENVHRGGGRYISISGTTISFTIQAIERRTRSI